MRPRRFRSVRTGFIALAIAAAVAIGACSGEPLTTREKGTLGGGGALVGLAVGHPLAGAAIGGVVGAGVGMAVGHGMQNSEDRDDTGETA